jgi:hypothetical protein
MSAILLETNGKESSSKRTNHINVRYFLIKDRVAAREITIKHCPTNDMLADSFTKPAQGNQFRKLRSQIQGIPTDTNGALVGWDQPCLKPKTGPKQGIPSPQECVGTKTTRTNGTASTPGGIRDTIPSANAGASIKDTIPSTNANATRSILTTHCATRRPASRRITSYAEIARRALQLPTKSA